MTDTKPSLTEFLLARFAEEEAVAKAATPGPWSLDEDGCCIYAPGAGLLVQVSLGDGNGGDEDAVHIARHDPARILADCSAKRRIVERAALLVGVNPQTLPTSAGAEFAYHNVLQLLALPYASHPSYREEWRP